MLEETAEEKAYFESRGATEIPETKEAPVEQVVGQEAEKPVETKENKEIPFVPEAEEKPGFVPKEALGEARRVLKESRAESNELREKIAKMEVAYQSILQKLQPQDKPLNYSDDPDTFIKKFVEETQQTISSVTGELQTQKESREQESQRQAFANAVVTKEREFLSKNPEYNNAQKFWQEKRLEQLAFTIPDPAERQKVLNEEATWIASRVLNSNGNPAEVIYNQALAMGWKPEAKPDVVNKIQTIKNGQERSTNVLGEAPTGAPSSLEELAKLPPDEFDKHFDRIMGKKSNSGLFN